MLTEPLAANFNAYANAARSAPVGENALKRVVDTGLLLCALPPALGGAGESLDVLAERARFMRENDATAAEVLWAQRLAIEALVRSPNVGLRELWLPDLLSGLRAGTVALNGPPLKGHDKGRGWLLTGRLKDVANLAWEGFSLVAPIRLGDGPPGWALLRSEEDGLSVESLLATAGQGPSNGLSTLSIQGVFFREDEWLGGPELQMHLTPVARALSGAQPHSST